MKKLKQEVGFPGQTLGVRAAVPHPHPCQTSFPYLGHPQVGEQSHSEIQQPPPGPESYAPPFRPSLEEDSASLSGESLDGHLQGECASQPFLPWGQRAREEGTRRQLPGAGLGGLAGWGPVDLGLWVWLCG